VEHKTTGGTRLRQLETELENGNYQGVSLFWEEVGLNGAPIIEPYREDQSLILITFLFRSSKPDLNIMVFGSFPGYRYQENKLARLKETDVWYKTYLLRSDVRFSYGFSVCDEDTDDYEIIYKNRVLDKLNPRRLLFKKDEEDPAGEPFELSLIELPNAPTLKWIGNKYGNKEQGELIFYRFLSKSNAKSRRVWVYIPYEYIVNKCTCNLVVLMDGLDFLERLNGRDVLDNLISEKKIAPTICVFVDNKEDRYEELTCNGKFADYLVFELVPWIRNRYTIYKEPSKTVIGGFSLGGLEASYIALNHSDVFGKVVSLSGSYWWKDEALIEKYKGQNTLSIKFYLSIGLLEDEPYDTEPIMMKCVDRFYNVLIEKGYAPCYEKSHSGHDYLSWGESLGSGLAYLLDEN